MTVMRVKTVQPDGKESVAKESVSVSWGRGMAMRMQRAQADGKEGWVRAPAHSQLVSSAAQSYGLTSAMLNLHHTHGNRFVQRILHSGLMQAKLVVSQPGDPAEQEADRVAEAVMRPSDPGVTGTAAVDGQAGSSAM